MNKKKWKEKKKRKEKKKKVGRREREMKDEKRKMKREKWGEGSRKEGNERRRKGSDGRTGHPLRKGRRREMMGHLCFYVRGRRLVLADDDFLHTHTHALQGRMGILKWMKRLAMYIYKVKILFYLLGLLLLSVCSQSPSPSVRSLPKPAMVRLRLHFQRLPISRLSLPSAPSSIRLLWRLIEVFYLPFSWQRRERGPGWRDERREKGYFVKRMGTSGVGMKAGQRQRFRQLWISEGKEVGWLINSYFHNSMK